ncbi:MAG: tetratricopeptide repeat protein [Gemmatimonadota bacterium]
MGATQQPVKHLIFIERIASLQDGVASSTSARAGLLALRLVDTWMRAGAMALSDNTQLERSTRRELAEMPGVSAIRGALENLLDAMRGAAETDRRPAGIALVEYGAALQRAGEWALALDVYDTIIEHLDVADNSHVVVDAMNRRGACLRDLGRIDEAALSYNDATELARRGASVRGQLEARIGLGKLAYLRGNLPLGERMLTDTARLAEESSLGDVRSVALHELAAVSFARGQYHAALRFGYAALQGATELSLRERILGDLASSFVMLGVRAAARDAFLILAFTAEENVLRSACMINLMELAAADGNRVEFDDYRRRLTGADLSPAFRTQFELHAGRSYQMLGERDEADPWIVRALERACTHEFNQLIFACENAIAVTSTLTDQRAPAPASVVPNDIESIVADLRSLRELALIGCEHRGELD